MKNFIRIIFTFAIAICLQASTYAIDQTESSCIQKLSGFLFLKSYILKRDSKSESFEFSYVLASGNTYRFIFCQSDSAFRGATVYNTKRNKLFTVQDELLLNTSGITFQCQASGIYYFNIIGGAGEIVMGFKR